MKKPLAHNRETNAPPPPEPLSVAQINDYLEYQGETLRSRRDEIIRALASNLRKYPAIGDDEALGVVAENMRMATALARTAEERRVEHKAPFLAGGRTVDGWFKKLLEPLQKQMAAVQSVMNDYAAEKLRRERAAAEAERLRLAAEAEQESRRAAAALERGGDVDEALDRAAEAGAAADAAAERATGRAADLTRTHGVFGAVASAREKWKWRVINIDLVPRKYLTLDDAAINAAGKKRDASGKPVEVIPGIEWYSEVSMGVR
jgi:hypothetical protein